MKSLKSAALGAVLLMGAGTVHSANAADIYGNGSLKDAPAAYMPSITWTGFYVGGHLGAAFFDEKGKSHKKECQETPGDDDVQVEALVVDGNSDCYEDTPSLARRIGRDSDGDDLDETSWLGGLHLGYNWQRASGVVLGLEGDVSFADDIDYLASFRGRLGYAVGNTLFYGTGGIAFIGLEDGFGDDDSSTGWVAGLGLEHKLRSNLSVGLEGLYYAFDDIDGFDDGELEFWTVRARLTYHVTDARDDPLK